MPSAMRRLSLSAFPSRDEQRRGAPGPFELPHSVFAAPSNQASVGSAASPVPPPFCCNSGPIRWRPLASSGAPSSAPGCRPHANSGAPSGGPSGTPGWRPLAPSFESYPPAGAPRYTRSTRGTKRCLEVTHPILSSAAIATVLYNSYSAVQASKSAFAGCLSLLLGGLIVFMLHR